MLYDGDKPARMQGGRVAMDDATMIECLFSLEVEA